MNCWVKFLPVCLLLSFLPTCLGGYSYSVTEIPPSYAGGETLVSSLNDAGDVTGTMALNYDAKRTPFLYHNHVVSNLFVGTGVTSGEGVAVTASGSVGGAIGTPAGIEPAIFTNGKIHQLSAGGASGQIYAGNSLGEFVGYSESGDSTAAAAWIDGKLKILDVGGTESAANAVNNHGEVVGYSTSAKNGSQAFSWTNGVVGALDLDSYSMTYAKAVNDRGDVVGMGNNPEGNFENFAIIADRVVPLKSLPGGDKLGEGGVAGLSINNAGQVVGTSADANRFARAVIFQNGETIDLNTQINPKLGYSLASAVGINNHGQILVDGYAHGHEVGFLLTPHTIPLPASAWTGLATAPLLILAIRKKSAATV